WPYYIQYNLSLQHRLSEHTLVELAYAGSRGIHLVRTGEANLTPRGPRNPQLGSLPLIVTDSNSFYNSFQAGLWRRIAAGLTFRSSYTLSKSIDDQSGPFPSDFVSEPGIAQNFFNRTGDRGRSSFDRRHVFVSSGLYDMPFRTDGWGLRFVRGWQVGGIVTFMSGPPFTATLGSFNNSGTRAQVIADRPNLKSGFDVCHASLGRPEAWFDPNMFSLPPPGEFGNAGRNILCGPGLKTADLTIVKRTPLKERTNLELRVEFFNAFNHPNFSVPVNTQGPTGGAGVHGDAVFLGRKPACNPAQDALGCGIAAPNAGRIFSTATPSRQIQLAARINFKGPDRIPPLLQKVPDTIDEYNDCQIQK